MAARIVHRVRGRPPDPGNESAPTGQDRGGNVVWIAGRPSKTRIITDSSSRQPRIIVKPFGGQFSATFLKRRDGSEHRLQIFPDPHTASRCARLLNLALEGRL